MGPRGPPLILNKKNHRRKKSWQGKGQKTQAPLLTQAQGKVSLR